ncbi:isoleucine--tRNA ligase [Rhizobium lemnae]|uniref:Isoleucine--tRNA ligase n=1 Tax=Rhizobium lemnae TaxID=1214924 RepID=A0ABV8E4Y9_9HYPH|nr:isoleucine--tRNA ligase [Rhizobium lemnae]MCJ8510635.1 isoleucine--tRNA ligase [Rhizobium lemnae]
MKKQRYPDADQAPSFPQIEEAIQKRWVEGNIFERQVRRSPKLHPDGSSNQFVFYDGPPFANGLPHYGHVATGFVKDIIPRYQSMRGRHVDRRFGWDCHGLPAELEVEKELQVFGRDAILQYGIDKFNDECRRSVQRYTQEWEWYVNRSGRWVDFVGGYRTMDNSFMESVLWAFKALWNKGLIYEGYRVVPYSWAVQTPLSNFETRLDNSYRERTDPALTVSFRLNPRVEDPGPMRLLAWTTTPWTLPSNLALAVNPSLQYVALVKEGEYWIIAEEALHRYQKEFDGCHVGRSFSGSELIGRTYSPMFPYFQETRNAFRVLDGSFVSAEDGTGVVHLAPGFGEEDLAICNSNDVPVFVPVDEAGRFTAEISDYAGMNVFYEGNPNIIRDLKDRKDGTVVRHEQIVHSYPHCWRTDEPLIYKAITSWYVAVSQFRDRMVELNSGINWTPLHIRDGVFGKWLENARDWNISRNRFWGSPIPVWRSDDPTYPRIDVYGSIAELERDFGVKVDNLHRPVIDSLIRPNPDDPTGKSMMRRVPDVLDCWFESGSMPFAQMHYPFENKHEFERNFPGDFIVEYVAQTRGWFYTLMVLSTALFDVAPFRNCICHGVVLDENNQKLSKRLKNYPDLVDVFSTYGADALRWYMMSSALMSGGDLSIAKDGTDIGRAMRPVILRLWNAYVFFTLYANIDGINASFTTESTNILDRYIVSKTRILVADIQSKLDVFDIPGAYASSVSYADALNNWYIRNRRTTFWSGDHTPDKQAAYDTLYTCLLLACRALAPMLPYVTEHIYTNLTDEESVHLTDWPDVELLPSDADLVHQMDLARDVCSAALNIRDENRRRVRLPLRELTIVHPESAVLCGLVDIIAGEVNVKSVKLATDVTSYGVKQIKVDPSLGKVYGSKMKAVFEAQRSGNWHLRDDGKVAIADVLLEPGEFEIKIKPPEAIAAEPFDRGRGVAVLDIAVTEELQAEGWARDTIRLIQNGRKEANFDLVDRIQVAIQAHGVLRDALYAHQQVIQEGTLATVIGFDSELAKDAEGVVEDMLDGHKIRIAIARDHPL